MGSCQCAPAPAAEDELTPERQPTLLGGAALGEEKQATKHDELLKKYPQAVSDAYKKGSQACPGKKHVVLSTKYKEPWFGLSVEAKCVLLEENYTVYNPNTDNEEAYGEEADDRRGHAFDQNLTLVEETSGFVLQLQKVPEGSKSYMQKFEEHLGEKWQVARLSVWAHDKPGGGFEDPNQFPDMVKNASELFRDIDRYGDGSGTYRYHDRPHGSGTIIKDGETEAP